MIQTKHIERVKEIANIMLLEMLGFKTIQLR